MSDFLLYLLQVSGCFTLCYAVFYLLFRKLTFHRFNRLVLLSILFLSVLIPLLPITHDTVILSENVIRLAGFSEVDFLVVHVDDTSVTSNGFHFNWVHGLTFVYGCGFLLAAIRFYLSILKLLHIKKRATPFTDGQYQFFVADIPNIFSFAHWIFVPKDKLPIPEPVIEHEKAHVHSRHTFDVILLELYLIVWWFNPFVYGFRKSLRSIHEFQADAAVLKKQVKKSRYLSLLLSELSTHPPTNICHYFNQSIFKKRVNMLTKQRSSRETGLRYFMLVPVVVVLLMAFSKPQSAVILPPEQVRSVVEVEPVFLFPVLNHSTDDVIAPFGIKGKNHVTKKLQTHGGIDILADEGETVIAAAEGVVSRVSSEPDWGNLVVITHTDGYQTWYAHLQASEVKVNQTVAVGTTIGSVGQTGQATKPHLHFELRQNGERLNPLEVLEQ